MNHEQEIEEIIKEIAVKHGIAVGRDDPILILQTLNNRLIQSSQKAQQDLLDQYKSELEDISLRWSTDAKEKAERILNASLDASKAAMEQLMQAGAKEMVTTIKAEVNASLNRISHPIKDANRIGLMNIAAACITLLAATILLWITTHA
ncbi:conjugal transfer protein TraM [Methylobacter psychrophilus]|uniref:conjugal transfer protein TraM n=1 Tax=Methylobacter psychrophilus TaxID=96941 RepID=UPI0021D4B824|nr:conjugal transfer protein TraM [Methylobacter psychrophilus]